jgi:hypothetical protein
MSAAGVVASWVGAGSTFLAVFVALFKDAALRKVRHPTLKARIHLAAPDCHKTELLSFIPTQPQPVGRIPCYYFRIWVENTGNVRAEKVQVFVSRLLKKHADGSFQEVKSFLPMNLKWSHQQPFEKPEIFAEGISPAMGKHCDFFHIIEPAIRTQTGAPIPTGFNQNETIIELDLEVLPATLSYLVTPGTYQFELKIAATNAKPISKTFEVTHTGQWFPDEARMLTDGIGIVAL